MTTFRIRPRDLRVGDSIVFLGTAHRIVRLTPATHPTLGPYRVAVDATGWGISIYPHGTVEILDDRPASRPAGDLTSRGDPSVALVGEPDRQLTERPVPAPRRNALPSPLGRPAPSLAGRPSLSRT